MIWSSGDAWRQSKEFLLQTRMLYVRFSNLSKGRLNYSNKKFKCEKTSVHDSRLEKTSRLFYKDGRQTLHGWSRSCDVDQSTGGEARDLKNHLNKETAIKSPKLEPSDHSLPMEKKNKKSLHDSEDRISVVSIEYYT